MFFAKSFDIFLKQKGSLSNRHLKKICCKVHICFLGFFWVCVVLWFFFFFFLWLCCSVIVTEVRAFLFMRSPHRTWWYGTLTQRHAVSYHTRHTVLHPFGYPPKATEEEEEEKKSMLSIYALFSLKIPAFYKWRRAAPVIHSHNERNQRRKKKRTEEKREKVEDDMGSVCSISVKWMLLYVSRTPPSSLQSLFIWFSSPALDLFKFLTYWGIQE